MNQNTSAGSLNGELDAWARSGPGYPTRLAKALHGRIGMLRDQHEAVQSFQPPSQGGHVWEIDPAMAPDVGLGPLDTPIADTPAALSDQLLAVLFGQWPPVGAPSAVAPQRRAPSIVVREVGWDEWQAAVGDSTRCTSEL